VRLKSQHCQRNVRRAEASGNEYLGGVLQEAYGLRGGLPVEGDASAAGVYACGRVEQDGGGSRLEVDRGKRSASRRKLNRLDDARLARQPRSHTLYHFGILAAVQLHTAEAGGSEGVYDVVRGGIVENANALDGERLGGDYSGLLGSDAALAAG